LNLDSALALISNGLSIVPIRPGGEKLPAVKTWKPFQTTIATEQQVNEWCHNGQFGLAIVGGAVSGNLEIIDIDRGELFSDFVHQLLALYGDDAGQALLDRLVIVQTPRPGYHLYYRCDIQIPGNQKLAQEPNPEDPVRPLTMIETRGEGGYAISPFSPENIHSTGRPYSFIQGDFSKIQVITAEERDMLLTAARSLTEFMPDTCVVLDKAKGIPGHRPGDEFNSRATWDELLEPLGWTVVRETGEAKYWRPQQKQNKGWSASTNHGGRDLLYVFSSNAAPFDPSKAYTKFTAYAIANHGGDFTVAAKELHSIGYGLAPKIEKQKADRKARAENFTPSDSSEDDLPQFDDLYNTDQSNALKFVAEHKNIVKCTAETGLMVYEHGVWRTNAKALAMQLAKETAKKVYQSIPSLPMEMRVDVMKAAKTLHSCRGLHNMLDLAQYEPEIWTEASKFNSPETLYLLNVANCLIDLQTGQPMPHDSKYLITKQAPVIYDRTADCPRFKRFLPEVFDNDQDLIQFWLRWMAYSLTGTTREEKMVFLEGPGGNGKSVSRNAYMFVAKNPIGAISYVRAIPKSTFMTSSNDQTANITRTYDARAVVVSEVNEKDKIDEGVFKDFVTGEEQAAKLLYKDGFDFVPKSKLWMHGNHLPKIVGTDDGIWRRIMRVPFEVKFTGDRKDETLNDVLRSEASGIFNLILRAMPDWLSGGLQPPTKVCKATDEYRDEQNPVKVFIGEVCEVIEDAEYSSRGLYNHYKRWCDDSNRVPKSEPNFATEMKRLGFTKRERNSGNFWKGVRIMPRFGDHTHTPHGDD
jgi:putative DNA primase/helicase